jgi:hypothetical protein
MPGARPPSPPEPARRGLISTIVGDVTAVLQSVVNEVAPGVVDALDVQEIVERVDIQSIVDQLDIQSIVDQVDLQSIVERLDLDALLKQVDLDALIERIDIGMIIDRVDIARVIAGLDFNVIVALTNALLTQIDLNAVVARLDVNQIAAQLDVNALIEKVDIDAIVQRTQLEAIVTRASAGVASEGIDVVRSAGVGLDGFVHRWVNRVLRRSNDPSGPPRLWVEHPEATTVVAAVPVSATVVPPNGTGSAPNAVAVTEAAP